MPRLVVVISAPSGTGKTTICKRIIKEEGMNFLVSVTTRQPREGEVEGRDYYFVSEEEFERLKGSGELFEWTKVCGSYYGTLKGELERLLKRDEDIISNLDEGGALKMKGYTKDAVLIYLLPPSLDELLKRIHKRHTETKEKIQERIDQIRNGLKYIDQYDYVLINDEIEQTLSSLRSIIHTERLKRNRQKAYIERLLESL